MGLSEVKDERAEKAAAAIVDYIRLREVAQLPAASMSAAYERLVAALRSMQ